jgi:hypothetical protein
MTNSIEKEILIDVLSNPGDIFYENVLSDFLDEKGIDHDFRKPLHNNLITELKTYQEKCLDIWAKHWISVGFCTKPTDESKVEQYFYDVYEQLCLEKPKSIVWINNPTEMCYKTNELWSCLQRKRWLQKWIQLRNNVWIQILRKVDFNLRNQIWNKVGGVVQKEMLNQKISLKEQQEKNFASNGQNIVYWVADDAYYMQVLRLETPKPIVTCMLLAQEISWWFPTEKTVYALRKDG